MPEMFWTWTLLMIVFFIFEALTVQLVSIWLSAGCLAGAISTFFTDSFWVQLVIVLVVSVVCLLAFLPFVRKQRKQSANHEPIGLEKLIGQTGVVMEDINNIEGTGVVKVRGSTWSAIAENGESLSENTYIRVTGIRGVKVLVVPAEETDVKGLLEI